MSTNTYHLAFTLNKAYFPYLAVTLKSFCLYNPQQADTQWQIHLITDSDKEFCTSFFGSIIQDRDDVKIIVHQINVETYTRYSKSRYPIYTILRAELPDILLDVEKVLYLDTDVLFKGAIHELFHFDMKRHSTAMVRETEIKSYNYVYKHNLGHSKYYNSGGILMDLSMWRANNNRQRFFDFLQTNFEKLAFPDQDAINVVFYNEIIELPLEYNITYHNLMDYKNYSSSQKEGIYNSLFSPKIVHYAACAPWDMTVPIHPYREEWWEVANTLSTNIPTTRRNSLKIRIILHAFFILRWIQGRPHNPSLKYLQKRLRKG